jgi:Xaa-Pro aminopeptidase
MSYLCSFIWCWLTVGTGHGVGASLCVHEGPQRISKLVDSQATPLMAGMIVSNEPGYYEAGNFGIRIENLLEVVPAPNKQGFLAFKSLTLIPIQRSLINVSMLNCDEIEYLDAYHRQVREVLLPSMQSENARRWLIANTEGLL